MYRLAANQVGHIYQAPNRLQMARRTYSDSLVLGTLRSKTGTEKTPHDFSITQIA